jgi:flap endonuclease-1
LRTECCDSIKTISIAELSGKKIAVDISIYMYKYESTESLIENMYIMLTLFRQYNIIPIFIFDGKPPTEKKALLQKRREDKKEAEKEYNILKQKLESDNCVNNDDKQEIIASMDILKKQFIYINKEKIEQVKNLIRSYGATYCDAPGEADELCALLVLKNKVWACLSEDMDLFVYGCTRVLRYFSIISHTVVLYNTEGIYNELKMTHKEFKEICVLSGTDYNINTDDNIKNVNLKQTIEHFNKFKETNKSKDTNFYDWLILNTNYVSDIRLLNKINNMFNLEYNYEKLELFKNIKIVNGHIRQDEIKNIMKNEDFIFL